MREPLERRREVPAEVCKKLDVTEVEFSPAVIGTGSVFYQTVVVAGERPVHDGRLFAQMDLLAVVHTADIGDIGQQVIQTASAAAAIPYLIRRNAWPFT